MKKLITLLFLFIFLIGMVQAISFVDKSSISKDDPYNGKTFVEKAKETTKKKSSGGSGFITLWTRTDENSPCQKADVITLRGKIIDGKYGVAVDFNTKKKVKMPQTCPISKNPIILGWWNKKYVNAFLKNVPKEYIKYSNSEKIKEEDPIIPISWNLREDDR